MWISDLEVTCRTWVLGDWGIEGRDGGTAGDIQGALVWGWGVTALVVGRGLYFNIHNLAAWDSVRSENVAQTGYLDVSPGTLT